MSSSTETQFVLSVITTLSFTNRARWHMPNYVELICIQPFPCDILSEEERLWGNLIFPPERSNPNLWTRVKRLRHLRPHHPLGDASHVVSDFPLPFHISRLFLAPSEFCLFRPPHLSCSSSPAFFTSSLAPSSRELRHRYSVRRLTFHPLSY